MIVFRAVVRGIKAVAFVDDYRGGIDAANVGVSVRADQALKVVIEMQDFFESLSTGFANKIVCWHSVHPGKPNHPTSEYFTLLVFDLH